MNWDAFWAGLLGTTIPAFLVAVIMLWLNHRTNKALEAHRSSLAEKLSVMNNDLSKRMGMFAAWHQKRVSALIEIYEAFRTYLDFLRRALYFSRTGMSMDPMWDFRTVIDRNLVFLDDQLQNDVLTFQSELLLFWNWAMERHSAGGQADLEAVQHRLDFEIPGYLEKLRKVINSYADPGYAQAKVEESAA